MDNTIPGQVNYPQLLRQTYQNALQRNYEAEQHWQKLTKEYEVLESHLSDLPKTLTKDVMVPIAPRALIPGKIVHTNEILVCLGQGYFVKRSAVEAVEICKRRKKICTDMLHSLEKERELFVQRSELPQQEEAFAGEKEIIEAYDEEKEADWKIEHRIKEKEYRQKLAELKEKDQTRIEDEQSLWKRLDELELQEELEEELDRLHEYGSDDDTDEIQDEEEEEEVQNESPELEGESTPPDFLPTLSERSITGKNGMTQRSVENSEDTAQNQNASQSSLKRRVSFADQEEINNAEIEDETDMTMRIEFKHSSYASSRTNEGDGSPIQSPGDIYTYYKDQFLSAPKSILKKSSSLSLTSETLSDNYALVTEPPPVDQCEESTYFTAPPPHPVASEVVERDANVTENIVQPPKHRPVSRFKASRQRKKR